MEAVFVFGTYGGLIWAAASRQVWWVLPAIPASLVGLAALIGVLTYEEPPPEEDAILPGFGEFLLLVAAVWLASAVALGWAVRLWRKGRKAWSIPLGVAGLAPWAWIITNW